MASLVAGAYLVNNSRGAICDTDAVVRALHSGQLSGALLQAQMARMHAFQSDTVWHAIIIGFWVEGVLTKVQDICQPTVQVPEDK